MNEFNDLTSLVEDSDYLRNFFQLSENFGQKELYQEQFDLGELCGDEFDKEILSQEILSQKEFDQEVIKKEEITKEKIVEYAPLIKDINLLESFYHGIRFNKYQYNDNDLLTLYYYLNYLNSKSTKIILILMKIKSCKFSNKLEGNYKKHYDEIILKKTNLETAAVNGCNELFKYYSQNLSKLDSKVLLNSFQLICYNDNVDVVKEYMEKINGIRVFPFEIKKRGYFSYKCHNLFEYFEKFGNLMIEKGNCNLLEYFLTLPEFLKTNDLNEMYFLACKLAKYNIVSLLISHLISNNINLNDGAIEAFRYRNPEILRLILSSSKVNLEYFSDGIIQIISKRNIENVDFELMEILFKDGKDSKEINREFLKNAAKYNNVELAKLILNKTKVSTSTLEKSLVLSSKYGNEDIVKILIRYKSNLNVDEALEVSCRNGNYNIVKILLNNSDNNDKQQIDIYNIYYSCHTLASKNGHSNVCELLLEYYILESIRKLFE